MVLIKQGTGRHGIQHTVISALPSPNPGSQSCALNAGEEERGLEFRFWSKLNGKNDRRRDSARAFSIVL